MIVSLIVGLFLFGMIFKHLAWRFFPEKINSKVYYTVESIIVLIFVITLANYFLSFQDVFSNLILPILVFNFIFILSLILFGLGIGLSLLKNLIGIEKFERPLLDLVAGVSRISYITLSFVLCLFEISKANAFQTNIYIRATILGLALIVGCLHGFGLLKENNTIKKIITSFYILVLVALTGMLFESSFSLSFTTSNFAFISAALISMIAFHTVHTLRTSSRALNEIGILNEVGVDKQSSTLSQSIEFEVNELTHKESNATFLKSESSSVIDLKSLRK